MKDIFPNSPRLQSKTLNPTRSLLKILFLSNSEIKLFGK